MSWWRRKSLQGLGIRGCCVFGRAGCQLPSCVRTLRLHLPHWPQRPFPAAAPPCLCSVNFFNLLIFSKKYASRRLALIVGVVDEDPQGHKPLTLTHTVIPGYRGCSGNTCALPSPTLPFLPQPASPPRHVHVATGSRLLQRREHTPHFQVQEPRRSEELRACVGLVPSVSMDICPGPSCPQSKAAMVPCLAGPSGSCPSVFCAGSRLGNLSYDTECTKPAEGGILSPSPTYFLCLGTSGFRDLVEKPRRASISSWSQEF